jgi:hypothetical protein
MTRRVVLMTFVIICLIAVSAMAVEPVAGKARPEAPRFGNLDSAKAASAKDGRPIILDFFAVW